MSFTNTELTNVHAHDDAAQAKLLAEKLPAGAKGELCWSADSCM